MPCRAWLEIDLRDTQLATRDAALKRIEKASRRNLRAARSEVQVWSGSTWMRRRSARRNLSETIKQVCAELGLPAKEMISRAYHDTLFMARICPTVMLFIPCRGGVSHRPDEYSSPGQIQTG